MKNRYFVESRWICYLYFSGSKFVLAVGWAYLENKSQLELVHLTQCLLCSNALEVCNFRDSLFQLLKIVGTEERSHITLDHFAFYLAFGKMGQNNSVLKDSVYKLRYICNIKVGLVCSFVLI